MVMTLEEAIKILDTIPLIDDDGLVKADWIIAVDMAIEALKRELKNEKMRVDKESDNNGINYR